MKGQSENNGTGSTEVEAVCPHCKKSILFEFRHKHQTTTETTSKLVRIYKKVEELN